MGNNLEQRIGLIKTLRRGVEKRIGAYAIVSALVFGGNVVSGCETEKGDNGSEEYNSSNESCTHTVGGNKVESGYEVAGCPSGQYCKCSEYSNKSETITHTSCSCVSEQSESNYDKGY